VQKLHVSAGKPQRGLDQFDNLADSSVRATAGSDFERDLGTLIATAPV
jgi:hypothetical protein